MELCMSSQLTANRAYSLAQLPNIFCLQATKIRRTQLVAKFSAFAACSVAYCNQCLTDGITTNIVTAIDNECFWWAITVGVCRPLILTRQLKCFFFRIDGTNDLIHVV